MSEIVSKQGSQDLEPIAVIGMGSLFPSSQGLQHYWRLIRNGEDAISTVPAGHWPKEELVRTKADTPKGPLDYTYSDRGGFLDPVSFDPLEFGIPPTVLEATDTAQLLGLVVGKMALDNAGYGADREFDRTRTSVILGVTGALELVVPLGARLGHPQWRKALAEAGVDPEIADDVCNRIAESYVPWQENSFPGLLGNVVAGRIANRLNLRGTNCVVDAACASSLSALHLAVLELRAGQVDMVLTGGVDAFNDIFMFMCFTKTQALSTGGDAKPFSDQADGTVLGEGVGMVVLKRLSDAVRDGDQIHAVIRSVGTSSDGRSQSIYAPRSEGQAAALRAAYRQAGVSPTEIELVEAHGTGTKVGDAVETDALRTVYSEASTEQRGWCAIGSVKSQIGHTKSAAGAASLIKTVLALKHKVLPGTLKVERPGERMALDTSPFYINTITRPWFKNEDQPRRAAVSSFGFGGSNFHTVLEEYDRRKTETAWDNSVQIAAFSGNDRTEVVGKIRTWAAEIEADKRPEWFPWLCQETRTKFSSKAEVRCVLVLPYGKDRAKLVDAAIAAVQGDAVAPDAAAYIHVGQGVASGDVAWVFPGQGSQYLEMGRSLACVFPEVYDAFRLMESVVPGLTNTVFPKPGFDAERRKADEARLVSTDMAQAALCAMELGLARVMLRFGMAPQAVAGHSFGELVALWAAGRITEESLAQLAALRGRLMAKASAGGDGGMVAVQGDRGAVVSALGTLAGSIVAANHNGPKQVVLSGAKQHLDAAEPLLKAAGLRFTRLAVGGAFHSPAMAPIAAEFAKAVADVQFRGSEVRAYANVTADEYPSDVSAGELLALQLTSSVEWVALVEKMWRDGVRTFVEIGPKGVLTGLIPRILGTQPHHVVSTDNPNSDGLISLANAVAAVAALGYAVDVAAWEAPVAKPAKQAMTVPICGINYRSTYASRPARKPIERVPASAAAPVPAPASPSPAPALSPTISTPAPRTVPMTQPKPTPVTAASSPAVAVADSSAISSILQTLQQGVEALQAMHERTAQVHQRFLEGQQQAHGSFQALLQGHRSIVERLATGASEPIAVTSRPTPAPVQAPAVPPAVAVHSRPEPTSVPASSQVAPVERIVQRVAPAVAVEPAAPTRTPSAPAPAVQPSVVPVMLDVVAELTGYPADMIELSMDLESDLGIDSIKRVEILAAVQRRLPNLQQIDSSVLGSLRTLQQIVDAMVPDSPVAPRQTSSVSAAAATSVVPVMLDVVAELTGYPADMIELSMDLESDLGIDSIKRVEILAAVQRRLPNLQQIDSSVLGSLRTLQQIVDAMVPSAEVIDISSDRAVAHSSGASAEVVPAMLEVVAELTGYPADMIDLSMDLESDLGIDSIKRVEILAAVQKRLPNLQQIDSSVLGSLRTLQQIVDAMVPAETAFAPSGSPSGKSDDSRVVQVMLDVVSELTGYPSDMIELTMDLESDLGIDSIKRVEILAAVQKQMPQLQQIDSTVLGSLRTLQQIVEAMVPGGHTDAKPEVAPAPRPVAADVSPVERRVIRAVSVSGAADATLGLSENSSIAVVGKSQLAIDLTAELTARGYKAVSTDSAARDSGFDGLVIVADPGTPTAWDTRGQADLHQAFTSIQAAGSVVNGLRALKLLVSVSCLDGQFGLSNNGPASPLTAGLAGIVKTAALEWPEVMCVCVDAAPKTSASHIVQAIGTAVAGGIREVGVAQDGHLTALDLQSEEVTNSTTQRLNAGDVVVVTGGARGVTVDCLAALVDEVPVTLILMGRTALEAEPAGLEKISDTAELRKALAKSGEKRRTPAEVEAQVRRILAMREIRASMARLAPKARHVEYRAVDARNVDAVKIALQTVRAEFGPVRGLIHAAGVIEDRLIDTKTAEQFDRVVGTKVAGLRTLLDALENDPLRVIALFSSVSGRFGNVGQCDYSAANECLNKIAQFEARRRPDCRVVSLNWGPWDGGMVTPELKRAFAARGVQVIPLQAGAQAFVDELRQPAGSPVEVVLGPGLVGPESTSAGAHSQNSSKAAASPKRPASNMKAVMSRAVNVHSHPFLNSHILNDRAVMPLAMSLEWMAHAAVASQPGLKFVGADDLRVCSGLKLNGETVKVRVQAGKLIRTNNIFQLPMELVSDQGLHATANVLLTEGIGFAPSVANGAVNGLKSLPMSVADVYGQYLFHGPDFHGIQEISGIGSNGLRLLTRTSSAPQQWMENAPDSAWITDPLSLDVALQSGIIWTQSQLGQPSLPSFVRSYRQFSEFPENSVLRLTLRTLEHAANSLSASIVLETEAGDVVAELDGVRWTADKSLSSAFERGRQGPHSNGRTHGSKKAHL